MTRTLPHTTINLKNLKPHDVGKWVVYTDGVGATERGKLKSWNDNNIFVVFKCNNEWSRFMDFTGNSCDPKDVYFENSEDRRDNCGEHHYLQHGIYSNGVKCQDCGHEIGTKFEG